MIRERDADDTSAYFSKGQDLLQMKRPQDAINIFNEVIVLGKKRMASDILSKGYYYLGISFKQIGKKGESYEYFCKSLDYGIEMNDWNTLNNSFTEILSLGLDQEKRNYLRIILKRFFEKGNLLVNYSQYKDAIECYNLLVSHGPAIEDWIILAKTYINMGFIYIDLEKSKESINIFEKAIYYSEKAKYSEGLGNAYLNLGFAYSNLNLKDESIQALKKAVNYSENAKNYKLAGNAYLNL
ncbi:MAG: tetratricopeptide repeat protein, partial [Candidatus Methanofastidiosa archaeon]|nr:tetratricopeptide repeat protein [Candidatus Methanofastidiosa archaeon]